MPAGPPVRGEALATGSRRSRPRLRAIAARVLPPLLFAILVLGLWQIGASVFKVSDLLLPRPSQIGQALWNDRGLLADNAWVTLREILIGYVLALVLGVALGALLHRSKVIERAVYPWLVVSQVVPTVAIAPIFVLWTGFDIRPKVMVVVLVSFFPLVVNTIAGLRAVDPELVDLLRTMGASRLRIYRSVRLPAALPSIFTGMKVAVALSVIGVVFGEWVGSSDGLGYLILTFNNQTATAEVFAAIAVLAVLGIGLFAMVGALERLALPWYHSVRVDRQSSERPG
jgi:ABC-type nitrate/sulfonate/bicarbonate transport system permease component